MTNTTNATKKRGKKWFVMLLKIVVGLLLAVAIFYIWLINGGIAYFMPAMRY